MYPDEKAFDALIGRQFRILRRQAEVTQEDVAKVLNISYQQIQKYEWGQNRFPLGKLLVALRFLKYPIHQFIEMLLEPVEGNMPSPCIISIPKEDYMTLLAVAKGVERLAQEVRQIVKVER